MKLSFIFLHAVMKTLHRFKEVYRTNIFSQKLKQIRFQNAMEKFIKRRKIEKKCLNVSNEFLNDKKQAI